MAGAGLPPLCTAWRKIASRPGPGAAHCGLRDGPEEKALRTLQALLGTQYRLDGQGFELDLLEGGQQTLLEHRPVLPIEAPNDTVVEYLRGLDHEHAAFTGNGFQLGAHGSLNTFFPPPSHPLANLPAA